MSPPNWYSPHPGPFPVLFGDFLEGHPAQRQVVDWCTAYLDRKAAVAWWGPNLRTPQDREDLAQEVLDKARSEYDIRTARFLPQLRAWLGSAGLNVARGRWRTPEPTHATEGTPECADHSPSVPEQADERQVVERIRSVLEAMGPGPHTSVLSLLILTEWDVARIGTHFGKAAGNSTPYVWRNRARTEFRAEWQRRGWDLPSWLQGDAS